MPSQSPMIYSGKRSSKLTDEINIAKILAKAKSTVENRSTILKPMEKDSNVIKFTEFGSQLKSKELLTADEIGKNDKVKSSVLLVKDSKNNKSSKSAVEQSPRLNVTKRDSSKPNCNEKGKSSNSPLKPLEKEEGNPPEESHNSPMKRKRRSSEQTAKGTVNHPGTSRSLKLSVLNSSRKRISEKRDSSLPESMPMSSIKSTQRKPQSDSPISIPNRSSAESEGYDSDGTPAIPKMFQRREYTDPDRQEIIGFIVENEYYMFTRGNRIWKHLESENRLRGRSCQSLKEHFRKQIRPNIKRLIRDRAVVAKFEEAEEFLLRNKRKVIAPPLII